MMARYIYRFSILGPAALDPVQIDAAVGPTFERLGFATSDPVITEIKGLAPPTLVPEVVGESDAYYVVQVPGWGSVPLDGSAAARAVRVLTKATMVLDGVLPPEGARAPRAQVSDAVNAEVNRTLGPIGYFNLSGSGREAGFADEAASSPSIWPYAAGAVILGGLFAYFGETR